MTYPTPIGVRCPVCGRTDGRHNLARCADPFPKVSRPKSNPRLKKSDLDQVVDSQIRELIEDYGAFGRTGRAKYDEHGEVVGRHRGYGNWAKGLRSLGDPVDLVKAMKSRKGPLYQRIRFWLGEEVLKRFPELRQARGTVVPPHPSLKRGCKQCGKIHTGTAHRSHGPGAMDRRGEHVAQLAKEGRDYVRPPEEVPAWVRENPRGRVIYGQVLQIVARRTNDHICDRACKRVGHVYRHQFEGDVRAFAMPDGSVRIVAED